MGGAAWTLLENAAALAVKLDARARKPKAARPGVHAARRRLSPETVNQLVADYEAGKSSTVLMKTYDLGKGTVLSILEEHGVQMRGQGLPATRLQEAVEFYNAGLSLKRVAGRLDCSAETVRHALLAAGVPMRARWERHRDRPRP